MDLFKKIILNDIFDLICEIDNLNLNQVLEDAKSKNDRELLKSLNFLIEIVMLQEQVDDFAIKDKDESKELTL